MSIDEEVCKSCLIRTQVAKSEDLGKWDAVFGTAVVRATVVKIEMGVSGFIVNGC